MIDVTEGTSHRPSRPGPTITRPGVRHRAESVTEFPQVGREPAPRHERLVSNCVDVLVSDTVTEV